MPGGLGAVSVVAASVRGMIIDCGTCTARADACADCVVTYLTIGVRPGADAPVPPAARAIVPPADLDDAERRAISVLAESGLVPPLRLERREEG